jgi:hypothetical protein
MTGSRELYRDDRFYCAHPHAIALADGSILVVATRAPARRIVLHPPHDPAFHNVMFRSIDGGHTWSPPEVVPDASWTGMECAGLTRLANGAVMLNQWRFGWHEAEAQSTAGQGLGPAGILADALCSSELDFNDGDRLDPGSVSPLIREGGQTWLHFSDDGGQHFDRPVRLDTAPFSGGYGMRGAVEMADGRILLPLCDVPAYRQVFGVWSSDGGASWSAPQLLAADPKKEYEEPAALITATGRILLALRENVSRRLHVLWSDDGGRSWSTPLNTGIEEYPAQLFQLPDGRIGCLGGRRQPPYGIGLIVSPDNGETWRTDRPIIIRDDLPNKNLGYPTGILDRHGGMTVIYYCEDSHGVTGLEVSQFGPEHLQFS